MARAQSPGGNLHANYGKAHRCCRIDRHHGGWAATPSQARWYRHRGARSIVPPGGVIGWTVPFNFNYVGPSYFSNAPVYVLPNTIRPRSAATWTSTLFPALFLVSRVALPVANPHPPFNITRASHVVLTARDLEAKPGLIPRTCSGSIATEIVE